MHVIRGLSIITIWAIPIPQKFVLVKTNLEYCVTLGDTNFHKRKFHNSGQNYIILANKSFGKISDYGMHYGFRNYGF